MKTDQTKTRDVYQIVTNKIIEQLEKGCVPWKQSWTAAGVPQNLITRKPYRGINIWMLASAGYSQNYFLTFKQAGELDARIKKGQKAHIVVYWKLEEKPDTETGEKKKEAFLRYYLVYNISQCEGIPEAKLPLEHYNEPMLNCEEIINEMPQCPAIRQVEDFPYYHPKHDYINMPPKKSFEKQESYYSTLFHELVHSTGHTSRLNRKELMITDPFKTEMYSFEELVAEMGASYLNSLVGLSQEEINQNAAYIQGWLKRLRNDKRMIVLASGNAQKAVDFILDIKNVNSEAEPASKEAVTS